MPKVGYYELRDYVQLNMPTETKIDCETKNHLSLSEALVINLEL
jgi:hypothetical protein